MLGSQYTQSCPVNINLTNPGQWYNIISYPISQAGVYDIYAQFICLFGNNNGNATFGCSISSNSNSAEAICLSQYIFPPVGAYNHYSSLNRIMQITNTSTTIYMVAMSNYWSTMPVINTQNAIRITRIA
jgi:hypothetical protein